MFNELLIFFVVNLLAGYYLGLRRAKKYPKVAEIKKDSWKFMLFCLLIIPSVPFDLAYIIMRRIMSMR